MSSWRWISRATARAVADQQVQEHGGLAVVRSEELLESALARPENLAAYGDPDAFDLAAAYTAGVIRNPPCLDGNKRTGFLLGYVFLSINGYEFVVPEEDVVTRILDLAAGKIDEHQIADWYRRGSVPTSPDSS